MHGRLDLAGVFEDADGGDADENVGGYAAAAAVAALGREHQQVSAAGLRKQMLRGHDSLRWTDEAGIVAQVM